VLRLGSIVFGLSALFLLVAPRLFTELLNLDGSAGLDWAMRMIGISLIALTGNMFAVSKGGSESSVILSGRVMQLSAFALGVLTLLIPTPLSFFTYAYAAVGFGFSLAYTIAFLKRG